MDWKQSISVLYTGEASPDTPSVSFASEYDIRPTRNQAQSAEFFPRFALPPNSAKMPHGDAYSGHYVEGGGERPPVIRLRFTFRPISWVWKAY